VTDVLIRNVSEDDLAQIDEQASNLGLSRSEYLRRQIEQLASRRSSSVSRVDFERLSELAVDLLDDDVMRDAWS
jgi:hypothetical protein